MKGVKLTMTKGKNNENKKKYPAKNRGGSKDSRNYQSKRCPTSSDAPKVPETNDPVWYNNDPQLLKDSANLPFSYNIGAELDFGLPSDVHNSGYNSIPGIMNLYTLAGPGMADEPNSAVNVAAKKLYSTVRFKNSGHANYESGDLMIYFLAMDQAYTLFAFASRIYGIARTYSAVNRYYPAAIIHAMGLSYAEVLSNLANLRYRINVFATKLSTMMIPDGFSYLSRHMWLYSNLYQDRPNAKCQTFVVNPTGFYVYNPTKYTTGGALVYEHWYTPGENLRTLNDLYSLMDRMIDSIYSDEDMNIMSGDIMKAFDKFVVLPDIPEDYAITPLYDENVLVQIQNARSVGSKLAADVISVGQDKFDTRDIYQMDGTIRYTPHLAYDSSAIRSKALVNLQPNVEPSPEIVAEATRFTNVALWVDTAKKKVTRVGMGADLYLGYTIITFRRNGNTWGEVAVPVNKEGGVLSSTYQVVTHADPVDLLCKVGLIGQTSAFDWHPYLFINVKADASESSSENFTGPQGDIGTFTLVEADVMNRIHDACNLSLFSI